MKFKKWVKSIQTAGYNGARTEFREFVDAFGNYRVSHFEMDFMNWL